MTATDDLSPPRRRHPLRTVLTGIGVLALVAMFVAGVLSFLPGGLAGLGGRVSPPDVQGEVLWTSEDTAVQLGPKGWITHPGDGGDYVARNVRTGESWTIGDLASQMSISEEGVVVQPDDQRILVQREGSTQATTTTKILEAFGYADLWPGTDSKVVAFGADHVAVTTCLAPKPSRMSDEVDGSHIVLAGIALDDASVAWTRDTGASCGPGYRDRGKPQTLPALQYVLVSSGEDATSAVDLATGTVVERWRGRAAREAVVQGEHVLAPVGGDRVTWSSLRTGTLIAEVTCPGAGPGDPGDISQQLAPEATPFVDCADDVHALDGHRFVPVGAPPARTGAPLGEGKQVALGHLFLQREGEVVHLRDGLRDKPIADLQVPADHQLAGFVPSGRLVTFVKWEEGERRNTGAYRAFDTTTGAVVVTTGGGMRTGADASPDGIIVVESDDEDLEGTRLWLAGTKDET